MRLWRPDMTNSPGPLERGPRTRQLYKPKGRARRTLRFLKRFSGDRLAALGTRAAALHGRPGLSVRFDAEKNLYIAHEDENHAFAHPERLWTVFSGQLARGKKMAYEYLLDQIDFEDGDRIIDAGANTGDLALAFRVMGRKVRITAFEPSPGEFAALGYNLQNCSAVIEHSAHQMALWEDDAGELAFHLKAAKGDSSVLPIEDATDVVRVPGRRLDSVLADTDVTYRLLKLEAEGAEPEILRGAEGVLPRIDYIAADVGFERGLTSESTLPEVTNYLLQRGFEVVGFEAGRMVMLFRNARTR